MFLNLYGGFFFQIVRNKFSNEIQVLQAYRWFRLLFKVQLINRSLELI